MRVTIFARRSRRFWAACAFILLVFLIGGGARPDIQSLAILRPLSVLVFGYGLWHIKRAALARHWPTLGWLVATMLVVLLQLVPLPPAIWQALPGRAVVGEIDRMAGLGSIWRPLTLVPTGTWNAFFSLFVPLAAMLLALRLSREERFDLLPVFIGCALASGLLGAIQVISGDDAFYFYRITNTGLAVGLFSNRNHAAVYLAAVFPMLAVYISRPAATRELARFRLWMASAAGLVVVPLIFFTGSRAGLIVGLMGLLSVPMLYRAAPVQTKERREASGRSGRRGRGRRASFRLPLPYVLGAVAIASLAAVSIVSMRGNAFQRLLQSSDTENRAQIWSASWKMAWEYFPFGSGAGSFPEVFKVGEPQEALGPTFANHAHNDWLETLMIAGVPGLVLAFALIAIWAYYSYVAWRVTNPMTREAGFARMSSVIVLMLVFASVADYPLRVPSMMCFAAILALWLEGELRHGGGAEAGNVMEVGDALR